MNFIFSTSIENQLEYFVVKYKLYEANLEIIGF